MTHWITPSNRANAKILNTKHIWGVPRQNKTLLHRVKPDDTTLPSAITGAYEVVAEPYEDHSPLFVAPPHMGDEVFPYRMKVRPIKVFTEPLEFKPLIPDLTFITNKTMWSGHLRQAMREIPEEDCRLILRRGGGGVTDV